MKFGLELEFFVKNEKGIFIPAYKVTNSVDGNPVIGELRTAVHDNIVDCIFELKKLFYQKCKELKTSKCSLELVHTIKVSTDFIQALRRDQSYINKKEMSLLEEFSVYPGNKVGKALPRKIYKASLQVSLSQNNLFSYSTFHKRTIGDEYDYEEITKDYNYSEIFDFPSTIFLLDKTFQYDIRKSKRVKGVYTVEKGKFGKRIEYRSLPNTINLNTLMDILST